MATNPRIIVICTKRLIHKANVIQSDFAGYSVRLFGSILHYTEVKFVNHRFVSFVLFDKHQHIDGIVTILFRYADITIMKSIRFRNRIVFVCHYI